MTPKSDDTRPSGTLPLPELNPLLNPVLNKHLGRWAEVYFTNPPEKRDEAVTNLLRELESEADNPQSARPASFAAKRIAPSSAVANKVHAAICQECGFENDLNQRFCGDCGAQLTFASLHMPPTTSSPPEAGSAGITKEELPFPVEPVASRPQFGSILHLSDPVPHSITHQSTSHETESSEPLADAVPHSDGLKGAHRFYIGLGLAVIIAGLAYMAWHSGQFGTQRSIFPAQAPEATTPANTTPSPTPPASVVSSGSPADTHVAAKASPPPPSSDEAKPQNAAAKENLALAKNPAVPALPTNGNQELATALSLLNGVGAQRDSTQAAQWLWKAVEKENTAATVLLAGLYLRGDGVQKNCDQGRILLDAAADKGSKDAASLLRNLQAFGCQ